MGAPERVDALGVVADHAQVAVVGGDEVDHVSLEPVRVLVLVDEHVAETLRQEAPHPLVLDEQHLPVEEEVVEIHGVHAVLPLGVAPRHPQDVLDQG